MTANYKNVQLSSHILPLIRYMEPVEEKREKLYELSNNWDSLALLSQLGDAGVRIDEIKSNFTGLSSELIDHMAKELLEKRVGEMESKARVAVDIVIRNLFERTADIGFLATDEDIRKLLRTHATKYTPGYAEDREAIKARFEEYVGKYSVYSDIVLMNTHGDILASLDDDLMLERSKDVLIAQALATSDEYVETYKAHDFLPGKGKTLVYSYRVTESNDEGSEPLGVLSLCFKFEDEMAGIFKDLVDPHTKECIMLLDRDGEVIASSDHYHVPVGAKLEVVKEDAYKIIAFGGRDYLARSCETNGYQGFYGMGWYGHILIPLDHAFNEMGEEHFQMERSQLLSILQNGERFSDELKQIPLRASSIQNNLNRTIWNGNIKQSSAKQAQNKQFSRALLQEIRKTGENTKEIIGSSIAKLTKTMVLGDSVFLADLIVDIMDRNLYERANDCRWWALTSDFRTIMQQPGVGAADRDRMCSILTYINDLYTVYTNLFIYDNNGVVVAVSNPAESYLIGRRLNEGWVSQCLRLEDSSKYCVSNFEASTLYAGRPTYIYNAAIRSLEDESRVVGGIGIVFDASEQFDAMILESLPKRPDGEVKEGVFAVLATSEQSIIASNDAEHETGSFFEVDRKFFALEPGQSQSEIIIYRGKYYALGVTCSKGYREYKSREDDYANNVYSFFFSFISEVSESVVEEEHAFSLEKDVSSDADSQSIDVASFMVKSQWLGVAADEVVEALSADALKSTVRIDDEHHFKGTVIYKDNVVSVIDIRNFINEKSDELYREIVILRYGDGYLGILVNSLGDIPEVHAERIRPLQEYIVGSGTLVKSVVFPPKGAETKELLTILSIEKINNELVRPHETHMIPRTLSA